MKACLASFWLAVLCLLAVSSAADAQVTCSAPYTFAQAMAGCQAVASRNNISDPADTYSCVVGWLGAPCTFSSGSCSVQFYVNGSYLDADGYIAGAWEYCGGITAKDLGKPRNRVGDPINVATGNEFRDDQDILLGALSLHRYYDSQAFAAPATHIGTNWRHTFDRSIKYQSSGGVSTATAFRADGQEFNFTLTSGQWVADRDVPDRLTAQTSASGTITGWTYVDAATRYQESYGSSGNLLSITDTDGLVTALTYSTTATSSNVAPVAGLLITVTDPRGRALNFTYNSHSQLATITEPDGGVVTYTYASNGNLVSVAYPDKSLRQYVYNEAALASHTNIPSELTGDIDETGTRYTSIGYNAQGQATMSMLASSLAETQVTYNTDGTATVTYPTGSQSTLTFTQQFGSFYGAAMNAPCGVQCDQASASATYDTNGHLALSTDFNGNLIKTTFDVNGLLDQQIDASGTASQRTTNFTWNTTLRVPLTKAVLDASNNTVSATEWVYNSIGQVLARCDIDPTNSAASGYACSASGSVPAGVRRSTYTYCTAIDVTQCPIVGPLLTTTGPRTDLPQTTTYSYYMASSAVNCGTPGAACYQPGDLKSVTDALGHVTTIASYDADGRVTRTTDANGITTDTTYTPRGWLASRTVGGATTTFTYTPYGAVASITDPDGVVVSYTYDAAHRLTRITDALGNYVQYTLDAAGNKTAEQVFDSSGTLRKSLSRTYNTLGQLTQVTDGLSHAVFNASYSDSYDANGNLVHTADALGVQRKQGYDGLNRLVQTLDDYNGTHTATQNTQSVFAYDANDRLQGVGDPDGLNTTYSYDGLGNVTAVQSPDTGTTAYVYDAAGNVLQRTDANGITRTSTYDALNRRTATTYTDSTLNVAYAYDEPNSVTGCSSSYPIGRLTRLIETHVTTVYCYDARGNVTQKRQIQGSATDVTTYSYTLADRLASTLTAAGTSIQYSRDADGRISGVTVLPPGTGGAGAGNVVTAVSYLPFGPITSYTLGNGQTITRSYDANYALTDIVSPALNLHFARDAMGDIVALGNAPGANPAIETYSRDPLYRPTNVNNTSGGAIEAYTYSKTGDRLSKASTGLDTGTYTYQSGTHLLTSIGNASRVYDADGNTTGSVSGGNTYGFGYNGRNFNTVAQLNGSTVSTYSYNALGQRVAKAAATSQRFVYDEKGQLIGEYGSNTRDYIMLGDLPVAVVDTVGMASTVSYVHADGLNTPRAITDGSGTVQWQWAYQGNPFGEQQPISATGFVYNLRFPGQYFDEETGLYSNGPRFYDAGRGGYIQPDPSGFNGGIDLYVYGFNDPLTYTDPSGLRPPTSGEIAMLTPVFNSTVDFSKVDIESGAGMDPRAWAPVADGNAVTLGNTIHFPSSDYQSDFSQANLNDQAWLAHEMTHVYQYQNEPGYSWVKAAKEGLRSDTYKYDLKEHGCFNDYRYEQQAAIVAGYYSALQQGSSNTGDYESLLNPVGLGINRH